MEQKKPSLQTWLSKITAYEREFRQWESTADKIVEKFRCEKYPTTTKSAQFNILWSNVQTLVPAVFARLPQPDVSRRFRDNDPVGRVASMILERSLQFEIDHYQDYRYAMVNSVQDRYLGGRGIAWVRYEPHTKPIEQSAMPEDGIQVSDDAEIGESEEHPAQEEIDYECAPVDYVNWKDFGHSSARTWEEVTTIWRIAYMDRAALVERFGEELGNKIPLDTSPDNKEKKELGGNGDGLHQAAIYEIWDKSSKKALWISKSYPQILDEKKDPYKLEGFWPCPRPLYATITSNSLVPVPDYVLYQNQAISLDLICERIDKLIQALQVKGVHDAATPELARIFSEAGNGDLIPVKNWAAFAEKNGLNGSIDLIELKPIVEALNAGYQALKEVKNEIYEIIGVADIMRGASDPDETYGAQKLKGQFGSLRLKAMRGQVEQYATELLQIKAQIMCTMFQPETLMRMACADQMSPVDQQMVQPALQLLKDRPLRGFRVEISSDSMVQLDETQEKQDRMEFLKASGGFLQNLMQLTQSPASVQLMPLAVAMMKFGVTAFKVGKGLEGEFDQTVDQIKQMAQQQAQQPHNQPPPQVQVEQMRQQGRMQELQAEAQIESQKFQAEQAAEQQSEMRQLQLDQQRLQMEAAARQSESQNEMAVEQHRQEMQARENEHQQQLEAQRSALSEQNAMTMEQMRLEMAQRNQMQEEMFLRWKAELEAAVKVEVANISSQTKLQDAAIKASTQEISSEVKQDNQGGNNE